MKKKKLKDQEFALATIKIRKIRSVTKEGAGTYYKDEVWVVDIEQGNCFKGYGVTNKRDFWRQLKEELCL